MLQVMRSRVEEGRFLVWLEGASGALQGDTQICRDTIVKRLWVSHPLSNSCVLCSPKRRICRSEVQQTLWTVSTDAG